MSEQNAEQAAEAAILGAVMAPDEAVSTAPLEAQDLDQVEDRAVTSPEDVKTEAEEPEEEKKETKAEAETPVEDEVEIEAEDGTATKYKLADIVEGFKAHQALNGRIHEHQERVEREYLETVRQEFEQVRQFSLETGSMIQAAMQLLQPPRPPNAEAMLNPASPQYDPDGYHRQFAQFQNAQAQYQHAQGLGKQLLSQAQAAQARADAERDAVSFQRLERKGGWYAEFVKDDPKNPNGVRAKFADEMKAAYGYSWDELDAALTDPKNLEVARDALAYRAMKAKSGEVKAKVEAKAPKLVRSNTTAKGGGTQRDRADNGQFTSAAARLRQSHSDADAAALFAGLLKQGRI